MSRYMGFAAISLLLAVAIFTPLRETRGDVIFTPAARLANSGDNQYQFGSCH